MTVSVRAATDNDLVEVRDIFSHYVLNTVISFLVQSPSLDYIASRYRDAHARGLPYLVAVDDSAGGRVVGYASASAWRGYMLGYGHTVEITLICHPDYTRRGIGRQLLAQLVHHLRNTKHVTREVDHPDHVVEFDIKRVLAVMAVDTDSAGDGMSLRDWYLKAGFEQVGRLKGVGSKKGKM
ncbi:hypothetical protein B0A52_07677 [Exophiala mesophila]|uniref:N-acetyltransferase domain-containing protein n=1 Tax=Exophiala mesophila TaxID=212818 RepID=A0A438MYH9_EXOME|nr:hypothetical protein B0A52_07677 [Exophiala mesophila]